jgi:hypothetical protein
MASHGRLLCDIYSKIIYASAHPTGVDFEALAIL